MNINHYRYVSAIAAHKNMSQAAKSLYISQPALTRSINLLEKELGVKLFERNETPIRLTYAGEIFLAQASHILELHNYLEKEMSAIATYQKSKLVIGIPGERGTIMLPLLLPAFARAYPEIEVEIVEGHNDILDQQLLDGNIDLCIYPLRIDSPGIDFDVLADDPIVIIAPRDSAFARRFDLSQNTLHSPYLISPNLLSGQDFLMVAKGSAMRIIAEYLLERHGVKYNLKREIYRHETIVKLVAEGDGMAISPCLTPKRLNIQDKFAYFSLDNPVLTRKLVIAYRKNRFLTPPMLNFIQLTREVLDAHPVLAVKDVIPIAPLIYPQF